MNTFTVITLFPALIEAFADVGIVRRACASGLAAIRVINPRTLSADPHGKVDDSPYGGGPGMVLAVQPLRAAITAARCDVSGPSTVVYMTPQGRTLDQGFVSELAAIEHVVFVAGRYEGIDERIIERDIDLEISLGDFVLSGGEIAAMAVLEAVVRMLPGALGSELSAGSDSFTSGLLEYPQYTRPEIVDGQRVPVILTSGNHSEIARWRRKQALGRTYLKRRDLIDKVDLTDGDCQLLAEFREDLAGSGASADDRD